MSSESRGSERKKNHISHRNKQTRSKEMNDKVLFISSRLTRPHVHFSSAKRWEGTMTRATCPLGGELGRTVVTLEGSFKPPCF